MQPQTNSPPLRSFLWPKVLFQSPTVSSGVNPPYAKNSANVEYFSKIHFRSVRLSVIFPKPSCPSSFPSSKSSLSLIDAIVQSSSASLSGLTPYSTLLLLTTNQRSGAPQLTPWETFLIVGIGA